MSLRFRICAAIVFATAVMTPARPASADDPPPPRRPAAEQHVYATPEAAAQALAAAMRSTEPRLVAQVLGPGGGKLIWSGDRAADVQMREDFTASFDQAHRLETQGDAKATLLLGTGEYPFPFPLAKDAAGWRFDAKTGAEEIVARRVGNNELSAIQVCLAYVDAQREYVLTDRDQNDALEYAQKLVSTPGTRDGLYWETKEGEPQSPLGPIALESRRGGDAVRDAYHGYRYKILTGQGGTAAGGAHDYIVRGRMIGGFALVAWPARWGVSGVMTFVVNQDGVVHQKNLGPHTREIASQMTQYDPDSSWQKAGS